MLSYHVTGHGFGHATRASAVIAALKALRPSLEIEVRTNAPAWIFLESNPGVSVASVDLDCGLLQPNALDIDLEGSLDAHLELGRRWDRFVDEQARALRAQGARLVVGDIPPEAFAAAEAAGVPALGIGNFCWDWVLEPFAETDRRWEPVARRYADWYAKALGALRLPLHGAFPAFRKVVDVPLICRLSPATGTQWRADRGLSGDTRPIVLLAFGGFDIPLNLHAREDLGDFLFAGFGPRPRGLDAGWIELASGTSQDQLDAMAACDVVVSKPGYGIISEAMGHGKRMVYIERSGFREVEVLVAGLEARGRCRALSRADFMAGRWRAALEPLLRDPAPKPILNNGAVISAQLILRALDEGILLECAAIKP